ncbi:MAG: hypothetical protein HXS48_12710 [Theionarchaea archaeon]|nr:hypothetical protein [Theionarchaea archaeon]
MNKNLESEEHSKLFYFVLVLEGEIKQLEEIERSITTEYTKNPFIELIDSTYTREDVCLVSESVLNMYNEMSKKGFLNPDTKQLDHFTFACILFGEIDYLQEFKRFIHHYIQNGTLSLKMSVFLNQRMHIMPESQWRTYCSMKQKQRSEKKEKKEK